jgi:ABC-type uncharacterized transport system involved in gliding motility auxiliary subunit
MKKYLNLLLFLGIIIATAGIVAGKFSGTWSNIAIGLSIVGLVIIIIWLGLFLKYNQNFWSLRSTEAGTNALLSTMAVILILAMVNFLAFRYQIRIDFTETKLFTLSPQSKEIIANLPQQLKVYIFERQPNYLDKNLLEDYRRNSSNFSFEFVDPQVNLPLTKEFNVQRAGEVYLQYGDKKQLIQTLSPNTRLSEAQLTNAIAKIQRDRQAVVYILQGHGEPSLEEREGSLSQAVKGLEDQGYLVNPLNLAISPIVPGDANAVIIATPQRELLEGEVKTLKKYLAGGGNLLVMLNANIKSGLDPLLSEWGVTLDDRLLVDASGSGELLGLGSATTLITEYGAHPITKDFVQGISVYPLARGISTTPKEDLKAIALLITNEQTWAESDLKSEAVEFNRNEDISGPIDLGVALTRKQAQTDSPQKENASPEKPSSEDKLTPESTEKKENDQNNSTLPTPPQPKTPEKQESNQVTSDSDSAEAKMIVIGNSNFATNGWFQQQLNGDVFLNSVRWLADEEAKVLSIRPKEAKNRRLNLTVIEAGIIGWLALLIIPALGFFAAITTWWKRSR